jgi:hypothetical protein
LPSQSACINNQYLQQYYNWYSTNVRNIYIGRLPGGELSTSANGSITGIVSGAVTPTTNINSTAGAGITISVCPLFLAYIQRHCGCASNVCTLYAGGQFTGSQ